MFPIGEDWKVCVSEELVCLPHSQLKSIAENYQVFSVHGVSFHVGKLFYPSGYSHTLIFDPEYGRVRSLTALETWPLQGGLESTFPSSSIDYRETALLTATPLALQIYLTGLCLGGVRFLLLQNPTVRAGKR